MFRPIFAFALTLSVAAPGVGQTTASAAAAKPYAPYEWLVGEWVSEQGGNGLRQSISWGPGRSYFRFATYLLAAGKADHLHFDGIAVFNGRSKVLDYLFAVEPGSGIQESGTIRAEDNGSIVREVVMTGPDGKVGTFRQTIEKSGADAIVTSLMRKTEGGWEPTFPGSERLVMTRSAG